MADIKYLLKFGKREHLQNLVDGNLYCSNAITFWGIEDKLKIKGQGDILEAGARIFAQKITMHNPSTNEVIGEYGQSNGIMRIEPAERMPVFCLFAVYEDDCIVDSNGKVAISLSEEKKNTIREHFPNADSVVVIPNPDSFVDDVRKSIGTEIKAESVHYFNIDKGFDTKSGQTAIDMEYMRYLTQDVPPVKENGKTIYTFYADYAYRVLFCKDVFFKNEQEYRIVLPNDTIDSCRSYPISLSTEYKVYDLSDFFNH
ncbi:MAG: hypothetical protein ACI4J7_09855 [Ruminiclostridium sp.]